MQHITGSKGEKRLQNFEFTIPVAVGTAAFYLGKKATEYHSHKWTLYVRAVNGEDLTHLLSKVVFQLHPSFDNPMREYTHPPYEITETGWGEFEIAVILHFTDDAGEEPVELYHKLKLYGEDDPSGQASTKKPVVSETYDELVFSEPVESFYQRVANHMPMPAPPMSPAQWFTTFNASEDLHKFTAARQRVAGMTASVQRQLEAA